MSRVAECLWRDDDTKIYYAITGRVGLPGKKSLRTRDRKIANTKLAAFLAQRPSQRATIDRALPFLSYGDQWLEAFSRPPIARRAHRESTVKRRKLCVYALASALPDLLADITRPVIDAWYRQRSRAVTARSFNMELETLMLIMTHAYEAGLLAINPTLGLRRITLPPAKKVIPSPQQFAALLATLRRVERTKPAADLIEFLASSGCRLGEALALTVADFDMAAGVFHVQKSKTDAGIRTVPIFPDLGAVFRRIATGKRPGSHLFQIQSAKRALATACKTAGCPRYSHHTFRHYFITEARKVCEDSVVAKWVGHANSILIQTTYEHVLPDWSLQRAKELHTSPQEIQAVASVAGK